MPPERVHTPVNPSSSSEVPPLSANSVRYRPMHAVIELVTYLIHVPLALQLAKLSGFSYIITTASLKHEAFLKSLGATHVIDRNTPAADLAGKVAEITKEPLEFVFDSVSHPETQQSAQDITAVGGTTVYVLPPAVAAVEGKEFYHALGLFGFPHTRPLGERLYGNISQLVEEGHIIVCFFPPQYNDGR